MRICSCIIKRHKNTFAGCRFDVSSLRTQVQRSAKVDGRLVVNLVGVEAVITRPLLANADTSNLVAGLRLMTRDSYYRSVADSLTGVETRLSAGKTVGC